MASVRQQLAQRIRELRRRHFGARGRGEFARRLKVDEGELASFEQGTVPPGDVLLRMCEVTGEDLQWLLTGVAARGTLVISNAPTRHQQLLTRIAQELEQQPELATPLEAFFELLVAGTRLDAGRPLLPPARDDALIPIIDPSQLPPRLPDARERSRLAPVAADAVEVRAAQRAMLCEPMLHEGALLPARRCAVEVIEDAVTRDAHPADGPVATRYVRSQDVVRYFPRAFAVAAGELAQPALFEPGDVLVVAPDSPAVVGRPALCRVLDAPLVRGGIWLGEDGQGASLGRPADGSTTRIAPGRLCWSLEVLYRVALQN